MRSGVNHRRRSSLSRPVCVTITDKTLTHRDCRGAVAVSTQPPEAGTPALPPQPALWAHWGGPLLSGGQSWSRAGSAAGRGPRAQRAEQVSHEPLCLLVSGEWWGPGPKELLGLQCPLVALVMPAGRPRAESVPSRSEPSLRLVTSARDLGTGRQGRMVGTGAGQQGPWVSGDHRRWSGSPGLTGQRVLQVSGDHSQWGLWVSGDCGPWGRSVGTVGPGMGWR